MSRYRLFIVSFVLSILAMISFMAAYFYGLMNTMRMIGLESQSVTDPFEIFRHLFSPALLVSLLVLGVTSLLYRLLGIIFIAKNKRLEGGEQALWIIGFVLFGFITAIVFMALRKSKNLVSDEEHSL